VFTVKWKKILSRGNNIEEGHFAERSWGHLFATPLKKFEIVALRKFANEMHKGVIRGALIHRARKKFEFKRWHTYILCVFLAIAMLAAKKMIDRRYPHRKKISFNI